MPTIVTKTIKASGGDYGSLAAWEAGENTGDYTTADEIRVADCYALGVMDGPVTIAGATTDTNRYARIQAHDNHGGVINGAAYQIGQTGFGDIIVNNQEHTRFAGLQVIVGLTGAFGGNAISHLAGVDSYVERCIIKGPGFYDATSGIGSIGIYEHFGGNVAKSNIIYDFISAVNGSTGVQVNGFIGTSYYFNNTLYNCGSGFVGNAGAGGFKIDARNNIVQNTFGACYTNCDAAGSTNNISDDGTHPAGKTATVVFVSTAGGSENFHLDASDTEAVGYGVDLSSDFNHDIDSETRSVPWDAGADQRAEGVGGDAYLLEYPRLGLEDDSGAILTEAADAILNEIAGTATDHILLEDSSGILLLDAAQNPSPGTGDLILTGFAPTLLQPVVAVTDVGALVVTGFTPSAVQGVRVYPGVGSLDLAGFAPTPTIGDNQSALPGTGALSLTGFAPTITQTNNQRANTGVGALTLTGFAPAPASSNNQTAATGTGALVLTGFAPTVQLNIFVRPDVGSLTLTGFSPTALSSNNQSASPGVGVLSLTGFAPTASVSGNQFATPGVGAIIVTGFAPTISQGIKSYAGVGSLVLTGFAPSPTSSVNQTASPDTGSLLLTGFAPSIVATGNQFAETATGSLILAGHSPIALVASVEDPVLTFSGQFYPR